MKKFLALVLALIMTMSLVTISAGAEDFADADSITYEEAVDVMTAIGVVGGYADGSFNPTGTLTRGAAAKIICNMILGPTEAGALATVEAPFSDVPADHVFAGYIAYCVSEGIVSGYTDGTFKPAGTLTGYAFMKMLLGALGYDAVAEGYTGANFSINVAKRALNIGLDAGLTDAFVGSKALTREEACLYAFNTMKATMVEYDNNQSIKIGDIEISNSSKAEAVDAVDTAIDYRGSAEGTTGTVQFCEKYFKKLVLTSSGNNLDNYGRPTNVWHFDGKKVGAYDSKTPVLVLNAVTKEQDIFTALGADGISGTYAKYVAMDEVYEDGVDVTLVAPYSTETTTIAKGDKSDTVGTGNGVTVEIYKTDVANHYEMVIIKEYLQKVNSVTKATAGGNARKINMTMGSFETEEFAKGDWVLVTMSNGAVKSVKAAEILEDVAVTGYGATSFTADGITYKYSQNFAGTKSYDMTAGSTYTLYLDSCGNVIKNETYSAGVTDAVFVVEVGSAKAPDDFNANDKYASVKYVNAAGEVTVAKAFYADDDSDVDTYKEDVAPASANGWYTVKEDTDNAGYVIFTAVGAYDPTDASTLGQASDATDFTLKSTVAKLGTNIVANANTTFVLRTKAGTFKVIEGIANVPNYGTVTNSVYALVKDGYATTVYVDVQGITASSATDELVYLFKTTAKRTEYDTENKVYYSVFDAIVDGEPDEIKVASGATGIAAGLLKITTYDGNKYISDFDAVSGTKYVSATVADTTAIKFEGNTLSVGATSYVVASDAVVYMIDADDVVTEADASALVGTVKGASPMFIIYNSDTDLTVKTIYFDGAID